MLCADTHNITTVANRLYRIVGDLNYVGNSLFYVLERNFSADLFPNISPQLGPVIDDYQGGNPFIENLITSGLTDAKMEVANDCHNDPHPPQ